MKFFLSSYKFGNHPELLSSLASDNKQAAIVPNAIDFGTDLARRKNTEEYHLNILTELGYKPEILDLRKYFGKAKQLSQDFNKYGLIWVIGGNTFLLRSAMAQSGLDEILINYKQRSDKSDFIYAGFSAGVCVIGPTLKGIDIIDEPELVTSIYNQEIIWDGLGLINYSIAPHYQSDHPESPKVEEAVAYFKHHQMPYKTLQDGEVTIIE